MIQILLCMENTERLVNGNITCINENKPEDKTEGKECSRKIIIDNSSGVFLDHYGWLAELKIYFQLTKVKKSDIHRLVLFKFGIRISTVLLMNCI